MEWNQIESDDTNKSTTLCLVDFEYFILRMANFARGTDARLAVVLGGQWGDEGKGKLSDVLAGGYDVTARFNGGNNAGHTVVVGDKKYAFHLLPCGLVYPHTINLLGNGVVLHLPSLFEELGPVVDGGIDVKGRLKISDRCHLLFDFHQTIDGLQENRRGGKNIGTTKKGIGPCYSSKATRNNVRVGQLKDWDTFVDSYNKLLDANRNMYGFEHDGEAELAKLKVLREKVMEDDMIVDGVQFINEAYNGGKKILAEGANAAMLDLDFGTYPYVTSSTTTAGGVSTGLGLAPSKLQSVVGVIKAYTTRVGSGPFPTELTDDLAGGNVPRGAPGTEIGAHMQNVGHEYGVTTGRKRRCGWFDAVVAQYGCMINGYTGINITKLDILDEIDEIKICTGYVLDGKPTGYGGMPSTLAELERVVPQYETMPGWKTTIAGTKNFEDLPIEAQNYVNRIEALVGAPVSWIGVGVGRKDMIIK